MNNIIQIVRKEIDLVASAAAREALLESYASSTTALAEIERFFTEFSAVIWSVPARRVFFRNWRSPGIGSASFCALTFRLLEQAESASADCQQRLFRTATRVSEVSREDVGIGTTNHQVLYDQFATRLCEGDEWKLDRYLIAEPQAYLTQSRRYREGGEDLGIAIIRSLPEELYNHGEFAYAAPLFLKWCREKLGRTPMDVQEDLHFVRDHLGTTESGHFAALVRGLEDYCSASGREPDWTLLRQASIDLLNSKAAHYRTVMERLISAQEEDPVAA